MPGTYGPAKVDWLTAFPSQTPDPANHRKQDIVRCYGDPLDVAATSELTGPPPWVDNGAWTLPAPP